MTSETRRPGSPDPSSRSDEPDPGSPAGGTQTAEAGPSERTQLIQPVGPPPEQLPDGAAPAQPGGQGPSRSGLLSTAPGAPLWTWGAPLLAVLAVLMLPLAAATTDLSDLGGWGFAAVLSPFGWLALLFAIGACVTELWSRRPRVPMLGAASAVLILCSTGLPSVVQPQARFTTAWLISGFVDAVGRAGVPPTGIDARFYWPAFFAEWAWFRDAAGADQLDTVLRWYPPAVVAVWAIGVYALARSMLGGTRAPWVAAWLFIGLNWIEQDYFSPQATGIVLLLTVLTFALGPLATRRIDNAGVPGWPQAHRGAPPLPRWRRWLISAMTPPNHPTLPARQLLLIYFCAALCVIAVAPTHQLTPFAIIGQLFVLSVVGRFRGRGLLIVAMLAVGVFILIGARDFWLTQISMIVGSGDDGGALAAGVADRLEGDTGQLVGKGLRIAMTVVTYLIGFAGAWVYWKRRRDLVPILLAVVPMGMAVVQSYGGELLLRVLLYGLPILSILATDALRAFARVDRKRERLLAAGMVAVFGLLILIRGGNEAYTDVTTEDVQMTRLAYDQAPRGATVQPLSTVGPYALEGVGEHNNMAVGGQGCNVLAQDPFRCIDQVQPQTLLFYGSIEDQGVVLNGEKPGWTLDIRKKLIASGQYKQTYAHGFNAILVSTGQGAVPAGGQQNPAPAAPDAQNDNQNTGGN
ncbi:hypothetical protein [Pseudonocardia phyllosphaerae]|uniref:hypothetical protein n=1 Tax=Pseudonocardia phyllosphaerae TaxID=3390502 RepID=UPI00397BE056